ncbi:DUF2637 domain-containing protein [Streptomyces sp. IMTB 1903]|uniref:DUF2637 domain-containing protein n=1 Tax=Streptomyces sp. IMTB 1903 TaxID=1776680 RepID=UPI001F3564E1|nr:DUF2637 domain-containing protein [Streptomyces sp. IMTB 1903]
MAVGTGAAVIAAIGFAGSYAAVVGLAREKGFGDFAEVFPIGIDAGIAVLLALDLLLSWIRIPFPVLRHIAWLLTAATIAFNAAAAWGDPIAVGMHATMPVLFVVVVEAVRHAVGRLADITADRHMEGVRLWGWALSPAPTFKLWRRMKMWELRNYEQAVGLEQDRLIYQARLQARYGRKWRRKAPVDAVMPLRLAKLGVPLADTAPAGLAAAGILIEWHPAKPLARPEFEEHTVEALEMVTVSAVDHALTPTGQPDVHDELEPPPSLRALTPAYAAVKPQPERLEITLRVSEPPEPECEDEPHDKEAKPEPAGEPAPAAPDTADGEPADVSTKPQEKTRTTEPPNPDVPTPFAAHNARRAQRRKEIADGWWELVNTGSPVTKREYAKKVGADVRTVDRALTEHPGPA